MPKLYDAARTVRSRQDVCLHRTPIVSAVALAAAGLVGLAPALAPARTSAGSAASIAAPVPSFVRHLVPSWGFGQVVEAVGVGDLNGDRRPDIVVAGDRYLLV